MAGDTVKRVTAKFILDSTGVNSKLKGMNAELKKHQSALKLAGQGIKSFGSDSNKLKGVQSALSKQLGVHIKKVGLYERELGKSNKKLQENVKTRDKSRKALTNANKEYEKAVKQYGKESTEAKKAKAEVEKLSQEHEKNSKKVQNNAQKIQNYETKLNKAKSQMVKTEGELRKVSKELDKSNNKWLKASDRLKTSGEKLKSVGSKVSNVGDKMAKLAVPIAGVGIASAKLGMDFEEQMSSVQAKSGATGSDLEKLKNKALEMGSKTKFSATEAGQGLDFMAMAGWKTNDMLKGLKPIMNLAIASNGELGETSDIVTDSLTAFGLKAKDAGMFSDVLAQASTNANTNVQMMGATFQYCAPVADALGYNVKDTAVGIGLMANAGIKADKAGTALRTGMTNLAKPTKKMGKAMDKYNISLTDASGKVKPFRDLIGELRDKLGGLDRATQASVASTIFGKEAMSGWLSIINASPQDVDKLTKSIDNSRGATQKMADTMSNNTKGKIQKAISSLQTAGIKVFESMAPTIERVANKVGQLADKFSKLSPKQQENIVKMGAMVVAGAGVTKMLGGALIGLGNAKLAFGLLAGKIGTATTSTAVAGETIAKTATKGGMLTKALGGIGKIGGVASGGISSLAGALGVSVPVLGLVAGGAVAVGVGAYKLHKHMKQEAVPSVDLFNNKIKQSKLTTDKYGHSIDLTTTKTINFSKKTKKAVGEFIQSNNKAQKGLMTLYANNTKLNAKNSKDLINTYKKTSKQLITGENKRYKDALIRYNKYIKNNKSISDKDKKQKLANLQKHHIQMTTKINDYNKKITSIIQKASQEGRTLKAEEVQEIQRLQEQQKTQGIKTLSTSEKEQKAIMSRIKQYGTRITAEQASSVIKNAEKQRQGSVQKAESQYRQTVANIKKMRDEDKTITADQAKQMIKKAEEQKHKSITKAQQHKDGVVKQIKKMNSDVIKDIDTSDGSIKTRWEKMKEWCFNNPVVRKVKTVFEKVGNFVGKIFSPPKLNWTGSQFFEGGLTSLHDRKGQSDYELYDLPRGTRIFNHDASQDLVMKTAESVATKVANRVMKGYKSSNGGEVTLQIENFINNRKQNMESLMNEIEFYNNRNRLGRGGAY